MRYLILAVVLGLTGCTGYYNNYDEYPNLRQTWDGQSPGSSGDSAGSSSGASSGASSGSSGTGACAK